MLNLLKSIDTYLISVQYLLLFQHSVRVCLFFTDFYLLRTLGKMSF